MSTESRAQQATEKLKDTAERVQERIGDIKDQANEYYEQGRQRAQEWEQSLEDYVREQPIKSLLIAAGVGLVLGAIWKRI